MNEIVLKKIPFFKLLDLEAINPVNDPSTMFRKHLVKPQHNADLAYKNNSIKTGYENFCIKKSTLKLFPSKDFDFIGKQVVCQKCCQKFASKLSYKAHAGTDICVRMYNGPNYIYLNYKNRNNRQFQKKNKRKAEKGLDIHDIKEIVSNSEIFNTLQTRTKVYFDNIIQKRNKTKEKSMVNSNKNNDEPSVKKPRGRPKKDLIRNDVEVKLKKRGRPKKLNALTVDSSKQNNNSSSSNLKIGECEKPNKLSNFRNRHVFNKTINEYGKLESFSSKMKYLSAKFWTVFSKDFKPKFVDIYKYQHSTKYQTQYNKEKNRDLSAEENEIVLKIEELEYDFKFIFKQLKDKNEYLFNDEIKLILTKISEKRNEIKRSLLKKTDMKGSIPDKGKENIKCTLKKNENETENKLNNMVFNKNEKRIEIWTNNTVSPTITMKMNDGCKSTNHINEDNFKKEPTSQVNFEDNLKTLTVDKTPNVSNSVKKQTNDLGLNYTINSTLNSGKCTKKITSIPEWKLHYTERFTEINKTFLCTICGHKFKIYDNFKNHVNIHKTTEQNKSYDDKKSVKNLACKMCERRFDYLRSYYAHIKTHFN